MSTRCMATPTIATFSKPTSRHTQRPQAGSAPRTVSAHCRYVLAQVKQRDNPSPRDGDARAAVEPYRFHSTVSRSVAEAPKRATAGSTAGSAASSGVKTNARRQAEQPTSSAETAPRVEEQLNARDALEVQHERRAEVGLDRRESPPWSRPRGAGWTGRCRGPWSPRRCRRRAARASPRGAGGGAGSAKLRRGASTATYAAAVKGLTS